MMSLLAIFLFPGLFFIFFSLFCSFMVVWRLRIRGWGLELCFLDWGFQSKGFGPVVCGHLGFLGLGLFIKTYKNNPVKRTLQLAKGRSGHHSEIEEGRNFEIQLSILNNL